MTLTYDRRVGQYRGDDGRFIPRSEVGRLVDQMSDRLAVRMAAQTRLLIAQKISLPEWQIATASAIKDAHLQAAMLAAGGKDRLTNQHLGTIGAELKRQYKFIDKFAADMSTGEMTEAQALRRSKAYGKSIKLSYSRSEKITRINNGANAGKRILDVQARHCPECLSYARLDWAPIMEIVPVGVACSCQNNCRCRIVFARVNFTEQ